MISPHRQKVETYANAVDEFRANYIEASRERTHAVDPEVREAADEKKRVAIACLAAGMLLHDRAVYVHRAVIDKIRDDFIKAGMVLPGHRMIFINDRPIAIPIEE
jgi:hypothetical protein